MSDKILRLDTVLQALPRIHYIDASEVGREAYLELAGQQHITRWPIEASAASSEVSQS